MNMNKPSPEIQIDGRRIGLAQPTYFIADLAANHDGDLKRAIDLIHLAKEAGADAAKFQHFAADTIVSDLGFKSLGGQGSHQASWKKSVFEVYKDASLNPAWTATLKETCDKVGITFFTSPYSLPLVDLVDPYVPAYKIGSGDITWPGIIEHMCDKKKPMLLACGASPMEDVERAMASILRKTGDVVLMQCNTNYTASFENFKYINLNVLRTFAARFPGVILGLSDHTPRHATVLGAVTLGARVVEKHFTDSNDREGPDHKFALNPADWREMVDRTRELELSLGDGVKRVEENEEQTVVLQRRSVRAARDIAAGESLTAGHLKVLRPCPPDAFPPSEIDTLIGKPAPRAYAKDEHLSRKDFR